MSDNIPLSNASFKNGFFWVCGLYFHSLGLFCSIEQKFIILMKSSISVFSFMDPTFHVISYLSPHSRSSRFSPILCSRSFIVLHFTFRAVLHFEFNFCEGYKACVQNFSFFFVSACPVLASFVEKTVFIYCLCSFARISWLYICHSISEFSLTFHWSICQFFHQYHMVLIMEFKKNF